MEIVKATPADGGVWIDGHWGWRGVLRLAEIAEGLGYELDDNDRRALKAYGEGDPVFLSITWLEKGPHTWRNVVFDTAEWVLGQSCLADDAERWLNANIAPDGWSFSWEDGEFGLWQPEEEDYDEPAWASEIVGIEPDGTVIEQLRLFDPSDYDLQA